MYFRKHLGKLFNAGRYSAFAAPLGVLALTTLGAAGYVGCDDGTANPPANAASGATTGAGGATGSGGGGQGGDAGGSTTGMGGGGACNPDATTCACGPNGACPDGTLCLTGLCLEGCDFSYQCGAGKVCVNGQCAIGCGTGLPCAQAGTACVNGVCMPDPQNPACDAQNLCPEANEVCVNGVCEIACTQNADCQTGDACNATTGACMTDPNPQPKCNMVGDPCAGVGQTCSTDGYCHYSCTTTQECKLIDNRFDACDQGTCKTAEEINPECTLSNPCPAGQDCISNQCL